MLNLTLPILNSRIRTFPKDLLQLRSSDWS